MAVIRLKYQAEKSMIPTRLKEIDLSQFGRSGFVELRFNHQGISCSFRLPYTRPYSKKPALSSTINLNGGKDRNLDFLEWEQRITDNYRHEVNIECNCSVL
jgi:hypothetical protein